MTRHCGRRWRLKARRRPLRCGRQSRPRRPRAPVAGRTRRLGAVLDGQEPRLGASTRHKTDQISPECDRPEPKHTHLRREGRISRPSDDLDDDFRRGTDLRVAAPEVNHGPRSPFPASGDNGPPDRNRLLGDFDRRSSAKRSSSAVRCAPQVEKMGDWSRPNETQRKKKAPSPKGGQPMSARTQARRQPPVVKKGASHSPPNFSNYYRSGNGLGGGAAPLTNAGCTAAGWLGSPGSPAADEAS